MADAAKRKFDCIVVWKLDRFGRSVLNLSQQLATLTSFGVRFVATTQGLDTDQSNPTAALLLHILSAVAEFERSMIRERTLSGIKAAQAAGKVVGRPSASSGVTKSCGFGTRKDSPGVQSERDLAFRR